MFQSPNQFGPERAEIRELGIDFRNVRGGDSVDLRARRGAVIGQLQQLADLIEREAEIARPANEGKPVKVRLFVDAIVAAVSGGCGNKPFLLVETDSFDARVRALCEITDFHA